MELDAEDGEIRDSQETACIDCHDAYGNEQFIKVANEFFGIGAFDVHADAGLGCESCHANHGDILDEGARPGEHTCKVCHETVFDAYTAGRHKAAFSELGLPGCITCHPAHGMPLPDSNLIRSPEKGLDAGSEGCLSCHFAGSQFEADVYRMASDLADIADDACKLAKDVDRLDLLEAFLPPILRCDRSGVYDSDYFISSARVWTHAVDGHVSMTHRALSSCRETMRGLLRRCTINLVVLYGCLGLLFLTGFIRVAYFVRGRTKTFGRR